MDEVQTLARFWSVFNPTTSTLMLVVVQGGPYIITPSWPPTKSGPGKCKRIILKCPDGMAKQQLTKRTIGVKGSWLGHTQVGMLPRSDAAGLKQAPGYSPGVVDANKHSLSPPKTICAW